MADARAKGDNMKVPERFPKVKAPYERSENKNGSYTVDNSIQEGYEWVFERAESVDAVEKIHGENVGVYVEDDEITASARRNNDRTMRLVEPYNPRNHYIVRGIQNSAQRFSYLEKDFEGDGWYFGELVGPDVHSNPYDLDENLFVPFDWLRRKATYKSYGKYSVEFGDISDWLESGIFSIFYALMHGVEDLENVSISNGNFVEGIVFIHPDFQSSVRTSDLETTESEEYGSVAEPLAKLKRDMYDWH